MRYLSWRRGAMRLQVGDYPVSGLPGRLSPLFLLEGIYGLPSPTFALLRG
jgi:hypothetical protein